VNGGGVDTDRAIVDALDVVDADSDGICEAIDRRRRRDVIRAQRDRAVTQVGRACVRWTE
jgi:hypothetical protein